MLTNMDSSHQSLTQNNLDIAMWHLSFNVVVTAVHGHDSMMIDAQSQCYSKRRAIACVRVAAWSTAQTNELRPSCLRRQRKAPTKTVQARAKQVTLEPLAETEMKTWATAYAKNKTSSISSENGGVLCHEGCVWTHPLPHVKFNLAALPLWAYALRGTQRFGAKERLDLHVISCIMVLSTGSCNMWKGLENFVARSRTPNSDVDLYCI